MRRLKIEITRFVFVGAANFILTLVIYATLLKLFFVDYLISLAASWFVGVLFSYVLNAAWVFKPEELDKYKAGFFRFFLSSFLSLILNLLALRAIVENTGYDPFYVQFCLIPFVVIFNFTVVKFWSLRTYPVK